MKRAMIIATLLSAGVAAYADDPRFAEILGDQRVKDAQPITSEKLKTSLTVKDYLGVALVNKEGERLGRIVDFMLDEKSGKFSKAVVEVGGFVGLGGSLIVVPYEKIQQQPGTQDLVFDAPRAEFLAVIPEKVKGEGRVVSHP